MAMGEISIIGAMRDSAEDDKGDGRGLCGQGSVFADFMHSCWLSEGRGRPRRPCPRLLHSEPSRLAVVTAFSLKLAATLEGAVGGSEHSGHSEHSECAALSVAASASTGGVVVGSEHSEHSAGAGAGVALSVVGASGAGAGAEGAGAGAVSVGGGVAAARIWAR